MAYYLNRHEHYDGALLLYQRNLRVAVANAKQHRPEVWYMRLKIKGHKGYYDRSTGLTNYEEAYVFAKSELLRLQQNVRLGFTLDEFTFEKHWDDWFERNKLNSTWKPDRQRWHENYAKRYFKPYFRNVDGTSKLLNEITPQVATAYWDWRITYWQREQSTRIIASNPKRRGAKTLSTYNAKKQPAAKTLAMEQSALNQIFGDAAERGRLQQLLKLRSPVRGSKDDRRATIEMGEEYDKLTRYLNSYRKGVGVFKEVRATALHDKQREQLYFLVMILSNSGLRIGEARQLTWADIKFNVEMEGTHLMIAQIRVPDKDTKRGVRYVQTQPNANNYLKEWREATPYKGNLHPVFFGQKSADDDEPSKFVDLNKSFQAFLRRVPVEGRKDGLLRDRDGKVRSLYSLRHAYATMRLGLGGVDINDLAMNMGCKVAQIERHYSHLLPQQRRRQITQMAPKPTQVRNLREQQAADEAAKVAAAPSKDEAFKLEALRRYQRGELSEAAFLEFAKLSKPD